MLIFQHVMQGRIHSHIVFSPAFMYVWCCLLQAVTGHEECVEALLQHNASFMVRDCRGRSPVHLAAACGHVGVLGGLLHAAQSLDSVPVITDHQGYTPLHWACYNGDYRNTQCSLSHIDDKVIFHGYILSEQMGLSLGLRVISVPLSSFVLSRS